MTPRHLAGHRLVAQGLVDPPRSEDPAEIARAFAASQGQDLPGVLSSLALRSGGSIDPVLAAFDEGRIVRGYPMRGTVFAVAADTLAWLTGLCVAGPLRAAIARRGQLGLDEAQVDRGREVLERVAAPHSGPGGRGTLRAELRRAWEEAGLAWEGGRGYHLLAELISMGDACYGPWREGETAVVHAPTWLPAGTDLEGAFNGDRTAAAAELARRYFTSRGPAGERDLAWFSKLPLGLLREALPQVEAELESGFADADGRLHTTAEAARGGDGERLFWRPGLREEYQALEKEAMKELLLPGFDELVLGYRDRLYLMDEARHDAITPGNNGVFRRTALRRGEVVGTWARKGSGARRRLDLTALRPVSEGQRKRFERLFAAFPAVG
ncbi:winged helix DNA-binding domain-containing protein [Brachybacterium paraconglomeratum]|uniref:winged helix DNA-binding domain-containing protein n=1 Tax=Brachybacterium paraconglomeratum TaxID=173362 RepID=UPI0022E1B2B4|nr:winged helix DNA-binding domain-containing protein [Brachybacterium paraconglomeratum]